MRNFVYASILCVLLLGSAVGQQPDKQKQDDKKSTIELSTTVAQTDVMVFTKDGKFVNDLKRDQFELLLDGKSQPVSFFDVITTGTSKEQIQLAEARGEKVQTKAADSGSHDAGRYIFFFIDDLHLSADSILRVRQLMLDYVNNQSNANDKIAIVTATGQLGFLQQLCENKAVLRAMINRIAFRAPSQVDIERPQMNESQAFDIMSGDKSTLDAIVDATMKENPALIGADIREYVKHRADKIVKQTSTVTLTTLFSAESFLRDVSQLSGRKLAFFVSDGFLVRDQTGVTSIVAKLNDVVARAEASGVVFYTMDARGLVTGLPDVKSNVRPDSRGRGQSGMINQIIDPQEGLNSLALDTGGLPVRNTNGLGIALTNILQETSQYYVLAWQWETSNGNKDKFKRIQIKIKDHPELIVRSRQKIFQPSRVEAAASAPVMNPATGSATESDTEMMNVIKASYPRKGLPTSVYAAFVKAPDQSAAVMLSLQIPGNMIDVKESANMWTGDVSIIGLIFNDHGKEIARVKEKIPLSQPVNSGQNPSLPDLNFNRGIEMSPGIYQIRVASRDNVSGLTGVAQEWIVIPDLSAKQPTLSTPFIGESDSEGSDFRGLSLKTDKQFLPDSNLRFMIYIYNANASSGPSPQITGEARILRNNQPANTAKPRSVNTAGMKPDGHLTYADELSLKRLPSGAYTLEVTVTDHSTNSKTTQEINFIIR